MPNSISALIRRQHEALEQKREDQKKVEELIETAMRLKEQLGKYDSYDSMEETHYISKGITLLRDTDKLVKGFLSLVVVENEESGEGQDDVPTA